MGIPLATDDVMGSEAKGKKEEEEDSGAPKATRQKLECVFHLEDKTEFDVSEIFSRPRVCSIARDLSLRAGFSLNSETKDTHTDKSWNFLHKKEQARLMTLKAKRPSQLLVVSPPSEMFMSQQRTGRVGTMQEEIDQGVLLLRVAVRVCRFQMKSGRHFIFEHPREASSWADPELAALMHDNSVEVVDLDQCTYGLETKDEAGMGPVRLPTRLLTNTKTARDVLSKRCNHQHRHVQTLDNNVKLSKEYPEELCRAILETLRLERGDEVRSDHLEVSGGFCGGLDKDENLEIKDELHEEVEDLTPQWFDDRTGQPLDPAKVRLGRAREYEKLTQREVYEPVLRTNAMKSKDAKFIRTKWVDTQKGDDVRCQFVGQEIAAGSKDRPFREHSSVVFGEDSPAHGSVGADKTLVVDGARRLLRFSLRQGAPGDLHRAPRRGSTGSRREVRGSLEESLVWDTRRTATLAEGTGEHAERSWVQR